MGTQGKCEHDLSANNVLLILLQVSSQGGSAEPGTPSTARFLGSHNPAQMKRTVLASFTDVLLLPVTIVPRTVGAVGSAITAGGMQVGSAAVQGIGMLNPQKWVTGATSSGTAAMSRTTSQYKRNFNETDGEMVFEIGDEDEDNEKFGGNDVEDDDPYIGNTKGLFV